MRFQPFKFFLESHPVLPRQTDLREVGDQRPRIGSTRTHTNAYKEAGKKAAAKSAAIAAAKLRSEAARCVGVSTTVRDELRIRRWSLPGTRP